MVSREGTGVQQVDGPRVSQRNVRPTPEQQGSAGRAERSHVGERVPWLLRAALADGAAAADAWRRWRRLLPDLDPISGAELALVPSAFARAVAAGVADPDAGRLRGLQRKAALETSLALADAAQRQQELTGAGVRSAVTGPAAAVVLGGYESASLRCVGRAEVVVEGGSRDAILRVWPDMGRGFTGGVVAGGPAVRWRMPRRPRFPESVAESVAVQWRGGRLLVAPPHRAAHHVLAQAFLSISPGSWRNPAWLLDLQRLAALPDFDSLAFRELAHESGWGPLFAAQSRSRADVVPAHLRELLEAGATGPGARSAGAAAARMVPLGVRFATRMRRTP